MSETLKVALTELVLELSQNARKPRRELDGWDHKREYRRLRDIARNILKVAKHDMRRV